jgi:NADPH:quinone reductase-like Zn-dependent oxidoreductase
VLNDSTADNLVPCSDMAGEIVAVGIDVKGWETGDRVCANFATDHLYGNTSYAIQHTALGGPSHGVLTEYRTFPVHVGFPCSAFSFGN